MTTVAQITHHVRVHSGFAPKSCWIAHVKELNGLEVRRAWNRVGSERMVPCPEEKRAAIEQALRHFRIIH